MTVNEFLTLAQRVCMSCNGWGFVELERVWWGGSTWNTNYVRAAGEKLTNRQVPVGQVGRWRQKRASSCDRVTIVYEILNPDWRIGGGAYSRIPEIWFKFWFWRSSRISGKNWPKGLDKIANLGVWICTSRGPASSNSFAIHSPLASWSQSLSPPDHDRKQSSQMPAINGKGHELLR